MNTNVILTLKELILLNLLRSEKAERWQGIEHGKVHIIIEDGTLLRVILEESIKPER